MIYTIELQIHIEGMGVTQYNRLREPLDKNIHKWIYEVRKEYGYRDMEIVKVTVDDEDVTERIKAPYQE